MGRLISYNPRNAFTVPGIFKKRCPMKIKAICLIVFLALIGCDRGLVDNHGTIKTDRSLLEDYMVTAIAFAPDGTAWIGTFFQGIILVDGNQATVYNSSNSSLPDSVWIKDIQVSPTGEVWFGGNGLFKYVGDDFEQFDSSDPNLPAGRINGIEITSDGTVWIASSTHDRGGIIQLSSEAVSTFTEENSDLPSHYINAITLDRNENLWIAFSSSGETAYLAEIADNSWTTYGEDDLGFKPYWIREIRTDNQDQVWGIIDYSLSSAFYDARPVLFRFNRDTSQTYTLPESEKGPGLAHALMVDTYDRIWVGTSRSVHLFSDGNWTGSIEIPGESSLYAIEQRNENETWIGTTRGILVVKSDP